MIPSASARARPTLSVHDALTLLARAGVGLGLERRTLGFLCGLTTPARCPALQRYTPSEHDVFVATFAKSGTNWALQICQQIAHRGAAEFEHIHAVVAWPEIPDPGIVDLDDPRPWQASPTKLRVIKTHVSADVVPYSAAARYLTVLRAPTDVVVSAYHFIPAVFGVAGRISLERWLEICLAPGGLMPRWVEHSAGFWAMRGRSNVFVRGFAQLLRDLPSAVDEIAAWMGVDLRPSERDAVLERSSFAYMKAHDHQFAPVRSRFAPSDQRPRMMREGQAGGAKQALDPEQRARVHDLCRAGLRARGSDLPYDDLFDAS